MPRKKPLVLLFAGPKGHGKHTLARKLGDLLSVELGEIDYTSLQSDEASDLGSPLHSFLARKTKQRSIVYLDEFGKTTGEIHKALLSPFDQGMLICEWMRF